MAEVFAIPPPANTLAKLTHGMADNLLTNTVLASTCPVLLAPAMNTRCGSSWLYNGWQQLLTDSRYHGMHTVYGLLACDRVGAGRMAEPADFTHINPCCTQRQARLAG